MVRKGWTPSMRERTVNTLCGRGKITNPHSSCSQKKHFLIHNFGKPWDVSWVGMRRVISPSRVGMGMKRVASPTAPPGCTNGIVSFGQLRTGTLLKPPLPISPRRRACLAGPSTGTRLDSLPLSPEHPRGCKQYRRHCTKYARLPSRHAQRRQLPDKLPKRHVSSVSRLGTYEP